jgi:Cupin
LSISRQEQVSCIILRVAVHDAIAAGTMDAGIAQENMSRQNITFQVKPGQVFVAPKGLLHYNHNNQCHPNVYLQTFNSADPGALNVIGALAALRDGSAAGKAAIIASNAEFVEASPEMAFAIDDVCMKRCGYPDTGPHKDGLEDLPREFRVLLGLEADDGKDGHYGA